MVTSSRIYWKNREEENLRNNLKTEEEYIRTINGCYDYMMDRVEKEINGFYTKYARKEGITLSEAKKRVSELDIKAYERKAAKYVKEKNFSKEANEEMRLYNLTMKVNRLEMLKANIGLELVDGFNDLQKYFEQILTDRTLNEFQRQAGILGKTIRNNAQAANAIVNASFSNAKFSDRIWMYQDMMKAELSKLLQEGLIQGRNPRQLAIHLEKLFGVSKSNAERLMRTELARVQVEAQKQSFERNGYDQYEFIALGSACDICKAIDGKHFRVKKMMPGSNAPPMHPNCRCSVAAWVDDKDYEAWLDYLDKGGTTEEWERMKNNVKTVVNADRNVKMKSGAISGARNPDSKDAFEHAIKYYALVRSMTTDVSKIANHTDYSEDDIQNVKNHIFLEKHDLGGDEFEYFEPDYMMAESWRRLMNGEAEPHDIVMIRHELLERELMDQGMSQEESHIIASKKYNYSKEASEFYGKIKKYKEK